ncbi:carbohydrate ABC transporter permease [Demequina sp.]|uniref:carbohydrate ABC transporter permease n=1 Tax=Demequina sp. TaxID=2050685 RepID=UPI0025E9D2A0|nr:carbohydrate ABC transporter permease [Demequina sp.]
MKEGISRLNRTYSWVGGIVAILLTGVLFVVPFVFIFLTASKTGQEASLLEFTWPTEWVIWDNVVEVIQSRDYILVTAFINSTILTVASVTVMVIVSALVGYVLQRRKSRWNGFISFMVLAGLIVPPAVVPTIWVMQGLGIYKTLHGLVLIEVAFGMAFCILMFRAFVATIPRELDEAAVMDGAGPIRLFFRVIFPLLKSVIVTVIVVQSVFVFNDFQNPLYFLPGDQGATVQLTLYNFQGQFSTSWNLLFMDIVLITLPMLIMYIFFNRQIVAGLTSGAVKG